MWPIFVQFRCPHSGTAFSLLESIDFYVLNTNSLVDTSRNPQFFLCLETSCYLQFLYLSKSFSRGFYAVTCIFVCFDHRVYRIVN